MIVVYWIFSDHLKPSYKFNNIIFRVYTVGYRPVSPYSGLFSVLKGAGCIATNTRVLVAMLVGGGEVKSRFDQKYVRALQRNSLVKWFAILPSGRRERSL